ncbi:MAG: flagellar export chaperone FliS [Leptospirales bacterium]
MSSTLPINAYHTAVQNTISPSDLLLRLYEGAIKSVVLLEEAIRSRNISMRSDAVHRSTAILGELAVALEGEDSPEWAQKLIGLYVFLIEEITVANIKDEPERLSPVRTILSDLLEGWKDAIHSSSRPASPAAGALSPGAPGLGSSPGRRLSVKG